MMQNPDRIAVLTEAAQLALEKHQSSHEEQLNMLYATLSYANKEGNIAMQYEIFQAIKDIRRYLYDCVPKMSHWKMMQCGNPLPDTMLPCHSGEIQEYIEKTPLERQTENLLKITIRRSRGRKKPIDSCIPLRFGEIQPAKTAA